MRLRSGAVPKIMPELQTAHRLNNDLVIPEKLALYLEVVLDRQL